MRDWQAYVRSHLTLTAHAPERQARIVRELAAQLEDFYRDAMAGGLSEDEAYARLRKTAMDRGLRLAEVAQRLLDVADVLG